MEGLNGNNRQPSNGLKINRQPSKTEYFYRQPSNERAKISRQTSQISLNDRDRLTSMGELMPLTIDLGLKQQANKLGLGLFDPKLYRLVKGNGKTENYSILTRVLLKAGPRPNGPRAAMA